MTRRLASFTDAFMEYTAQLSTTTLFRKWGGIAAVAGALERKVWVRAGDHITYPNLYTILVGPAASGKTVVTSRVANLWRELEDLHLAPSSVSRASLIDALNDAERKIVVPTNDPPVLTYNSLLVASDELGVLVPGYDNEFMNTLTAIWDNQPYAERKRSTLRAPIEMAKPLINILAGTTPSYLNDLMPTGAWEQGFISRTMLVYSGEKIIKPLFGESQTDSKIFTDLVHDMKEIDKLFGPMIFAEDAAEAISAWHAQGGPPAPTHPRLVNYCGRRTAHLLKLCMIACAATSDSMCVTLENYVEALDWLLEMEAAIPDIFKAMTSGGDSSIISDTWHHTYTIWMKEQQPIAAHRIIAFLQERTPAHNINRVLDVMVQMKILEKVFQPGVGDVYRPKAPK
jgi:hypothetical protein